ncbi:serine protease gd-like [Ochlerotatus camptorhynchus]|uniref:serine protease gd-like n=1 Tax=Ochlerotatus camptorhynchus TaxID=644619 RepID=UPI0031DEAC0B
MKFLQLLALCVQLNSLPCSLANYPISPCPEIFQYRKDSKLLSVYGAITVEGYRNGFNNSLEVILSMSSIAHSTGSLELLNIVDLPRKPARLRISLSHPLPNLVSIKLNRKIICSGPPAQGHRVTTIKLKHYTNIQTINDDDQSDSDDSGSDEISTNAPPLNSVKFNGEDQHGTLTNKQICGQPASPAVALLFRGTKTRRGEWPWLSAIYFKNSDLGSLQFRCGATLISDKILLTAAHCLLTENRNTRLQAAEILVSLGRYNIMDWTEIEAKTINPRALVVHSGFRGDAFDYDIGAIILPNEISYTSSVRPICLWDGEADESIIVGQLGTVVGWGFTESGIISDVPKSGQVPIVSEVDCIRSDIGFQLTTSKRTFCAGGQGTGPCQGDSGSGLYVRRAGRWLLRGIVSYALIDPDTGKCDTRKYAVYTDVAKYREWLEEQDLQVS